MSNTQYTSQDGLKKEVSLEKAIMETKENTFSKIILSKSVPNNSVTVKKQTIGARIGNAADEGSRVAAGTKAKRTSIENTQAIYTDLIQISRTASKVDPNGASAEVQAAILGYQNWLEKMVLKGEKTTNRTTKGLIDFVPTTNKADVTGEVTGIKLSAALKPLTARADLVVCGYGAALKLDELLKQREIDGNWYGFNGKIDFISVRNAEAYVIVSDQMDDDKALFLNTNFLERDYIDNAITRKLDENEYDGTQYKIIEESCAMYLMPNALGLVTFKEQE